MNVIKNIIDYSRTQFEHEIAKYISTRTDCTTCVEKIPNKEFLLNCVRPLNDFLIYTTATSLDGIKKII